MRIVMMSFLACFDNYYSVTSHCAGKHHSRVSHLVRGTELGNSLPSERWAWCRILAAAVCGWREQVTHQKFSLLKHRLYSCFLKITSSTLQRRLMIIRLVRLLVCMCSGRVNLASTSLYVGAYIVQLILFIDSVLSRICHFISISRICFVFAS